MKAEELDRRFDEGEDISTSLDMSGARRNGGLAANPGEKSGLDSLDREAGRLGVTRQSIIKVWLAERLERKTDDGVA